MKKFKIAVCYALVLSFLAVALCGCNTWKGLGNDIENLGSAISGDD
ncbi:MAG: hypothetical protein PHF37_08810 [Phycisphaerae bacterium]|nr:hypothetical protein [Phycisphaerae bacterium]